jgi:hypothetical protein
MAYMRRSRTGLHWLLCAIGAFLYLTAFPLGAAEPSVVGPDLLNMADGRERLSHSIDFLASFDSRMTGQPGNAAAADWIEAQLQALDLGGVVHRETFPVTVPAELGGSRLLVKAWGETVALYGLWPNGPRTTTVPPEGVAAPMTWVGNGEYSDFDGQQIDGRIVLMEFNSWDHWVRLAALGARAVVFVEPEATSYRQTLDKYLEAPIDVPRFWIGADDGNRLRRRLLDGPEVDVHLHSRMDWVQRPAWNIWVEVPAAGADSVLAAERIIVEAYYDGISIAPSLAPAAEAAASAAALLELARHLREHPPGRNVLLLFAGAHFQSLSGAVDFLDRHARKSKFYAERMSEPLHPDLFISLDLSTKTDQVGIWNNTFSFNLKRFFVPFGRRFTEYAETVSVAHGRDPERALVNGISPIRGMDWSTFVPDGVSVDSEMAMEAGQVALAFVTVHDARFPVNTPLDRPRHVNIDNLHRQSRFLNGILARSFADTALFQGLEDFGPVLKDDLRTHHVRVRAFPRRSQIPDRDVGGALVIVGEGAHKGVHWTKYHLTDDTGDAVIPGLSIGGVRLSAYGLEPESGEIVFAPDLSIRAQKYHGKPTPSGRLAWSVRWNQERRTVVVFPTVAQTLYGLTNPNLLVGLGKLKLIDAAGIAPRQFGYNFGGSMSSDLCVIFSPREGGRQGGALKMLFGSLLLINSQGGSNEEEAKGVGYDLLQASIMPTELHALRDIWRLNDARLSTMRRHAIENQRLSRLHSAGRRHLDAAQAAYDSLHWGAYIAEVRAGLGVTILAYPEVVGTLNDVIRGIVFFLALVIPTAFFGERLLFSAPDVRWQIAGFCALLLTIWLLIAQVHPAFDIAHPLIILLAFAIMAMAVFVLVMVSGRFNRFLKEYQAEQAKVHQTDISRVSAAYAAFMLGISNMRRRRLRTGLTLLTLTLLTFTVLSFTSFRPDVRYLVFALDHEGPHEGVLIRDRGWNPLLPTTLDYAVSHFSEQGTVAPRGWYISYDDEEQKFTDVRRENVSVRATGLLGLTAREPLITGVDTTLMWGRWFSDDDEEACLLPAAMASALGIGAEEVGQATVQIFGKEFVVAGVFDAEAFDNVHDLDGEPLTPADFQMSSNAALGPVSGPQMAVTEEADAYEVRPFVHLAADNVLILPYGTLQEAFGGLRSVAVRFAEDAPAEALIENFLLRISGTLFAGLRDAGSGRISVSSFTSLDVTSVEGVAALIVPMLIASLIVLNAMMGAVYERFREIGIYSSVGLAPMHIALLFIAEACVYAVIGVTMGYMLGQGLGRFLVHFGWLGGMNLNYSSLAAIISACMVMTVVLLSTIYPARVAARSAVPDTVRRWQPPPPTGDDWEFAFPFMVSEQEVEGLCGFLASYFQAYGEESIGDFYADKVRVVCEPADDSSKSEYAVQLLLWLAPFDMGVSQFVQIECTPGTVRGVYGVDVYIHRISGQDTYWQRVNGRFVNHLRKEFLIWHTLDASAKEYHSQLARDLIAGGDNIFATPVDGATEGVSRG